MRKKVVAVVVLCGLATMPAGAQIPVTDVAALVQLVNMVRNVKETIELMKEEYQTIQRLARGYGGSLLPYRLAALPQLNHNVGKYYFAGPLLEGLNTGDPYGERYAAVVRKVMQPGGLFHALPPEARNVMETAFATIEIADSIATMGVHESALARGYAFRIGGLIERLQNDVTAPGSEYHEVTAIADKIALAEMIELRLGQNGNQVTSSMLEQQLAKNKRQRDAIVAQINMSIARMNDHGQTTDAYIGGATSALQSWRLR